MLFITIKMSFNDDLISKIMGFFNIQSLGLLQSGHRQWFYFCTIGWINHYPFTSLSGFNGPSVHFHLMFLALIFMIFFSWCSSSLTCVQLKCSSSQPSPSYYLCSTLVFIFLVLIILLFMFNPRAHLFDPHCLNSCVWPLCLIFKILIILCFCLVLLFIFLIFIIWCSRLTMVFIFLCLCSTSRC